MKTLLKSILTISALSSLVIAPVLLSPGQASAQTKKGTDASYVGAGIAAGVTSGGQGTNDDATFGGNVTGRLKLGNTPFSARGNVLWSDKTSAIIPEVSLDVPIANKTNAYLTGGYSFVEKDGSPTPIGNKDAVVLGAGVESEVAKNFLVYTNTKVGINAYQNSDTPAVSINAGIGYSFK
ncbi:MULTISPECIES: outer membrane beta-barrel protein [Nostoc]|uniref:Outer membrane beta-barrel protein n=1 Tax=Nostoc paludosum FACHB-159 TaxID=2692908 RepID=A0ABR8KEH5_9NOSO|nr:MULTISPECIES: outer membrane beta-barrel protein [Nostoc]MBD2680663.1 outer membrane beta-barrel protein [Nostoc sp. FACHB-857]MBD2737234.1 outer membrane beta-barrel protein [Nostoc paludosum FACHB-159]